jgi:hypothetical protein
LDDLGYRRLQKALLDNPEISDVMAATGGFRKLRWQDPRRGKGKRGGLRVIYYYMAADRQIRFFTIYDKDELADLSADKKRALKKAIPAELSA